MRRLRLTGLSAHTHAHGGDYGFRVKTTFSAYHNHFSDNPEEGQGGHAPGVQCICCKLSG